MRQARAAQPNTLLRAARLRLLSPSGSGRPMSRQELADALNTHLSQYDPHEAVIDSNYVGKLERGLTRWPSAARRGALTRVLGVSDETALGLFIVRSHPGDSEVFLPAGASNGTVTDPTRDGLLMPCRLADGRMATVTISRHDLFQAGLVLGVLGTAGSVSVGSGLSGLAEDRTPLENFRHLRQTLVDADNLIGPQQALPEVHKQMSAIVALYGGSGSRADRRDLLTMGAQYAEFAAWLYQDLDRHQQARFWLDQALRWSGDLGDVDLTCYVLARKAQLAADMNDRASVVGVAEAAYALARPGSRLAAIAKTYAALGHAVRRDDRASAQEFDAAQALAEDLTEDHCPWGAWFGSSYLDAHRAYGLELLGRHAEAAKAFDAAIDAVPSTYHRDRGVYLARQATAYASAHAPEQAAATGIRALAVAADTGSRRILTQLGRLDNTLSRWPTLPAVQDFRTVLATTAIPPQAGAPTP